MLDSASISNQERQARPADERSKQPVGREAFEGMRKGKLSWLVGEAGF